MKNLKQHSVLVFFLLASTAFCQNSNLKQENAEKAIRDFVGRSNTSAPGSLISIDEITKIDTLGSIDKVTKIDMMKQPSGKRAISCWVQAKGKVANQTAGDLKTGKDYTETMMTMEFNFKQKEDGSWILWGLSRFSTTARTNNDNQIKFMEHNRGLSIPVQQ